MNPGTQTLLTAFVAGIFSIWFSRVIRLPAIIPLLAMGILFGPDGPWQTIGLNRALMARPMDVLPLSTLVGLGVAVILFEGGLSLNLRDLRLVPKIVRNLITLGAVISMAGATVCAHYFTGLSWPISSIFGALMIVTGPTVIVPLLKNVKVFRRVHTVLLWEGITIDAVGAITAVATLELVMEENSFFHVGSRWASALVAGPLVGAFIGYLLGRWLRYRLNNPDDEDELTQLLALGGGLCIYGISESIAPEAGLGAVTVGGLVTSQVLGAKGVDIRRFKGTLTTLFIAVLFMLLAANFKLEYLSPLWPWGFVTIGAMMFVVRPLCVWICGIGSTLSWREKLFVAWIGPRGIIAASMASIVNIILEEKGLPQEGHTLLALTFCAIMITVVFCGITARPMAWLLQISSGREPGLLIVGGNEFALRVADMFHQRGSPILIVDKNLKRSARAREKGLHTVACDALELERMQEIDLAGIGSIFALTPNITVNLNILARIAPRLDLENRFAPKPDSPSSTETWLWMKSEAKPLFAERVNWDRIFEQTSLGEGRQRTRKYSELNFTNPQYFFMPILFVDAQGAHPFVPGVPHNADLLIFGLEFDASTEWLIPETKIKERFNNGEVAPNAESVPAQ